MPLLTIYAQAPWGPVSLRTAESMGELLARGERPAETIDVGERDPADVVREALRMLPPPFDATGQIPATVEKARNSVMEAVSRVLATHVAETTPEPVSGKPVSHGGARASDGEAEPEFLEVARSPGLEADAGMMADGDIRPRVLRRPGAEVDAREIRTKLGLSQSAFAAAFGLKLAVLRDWEQGRTKPEGASRVLLQVIAHRPEAVREVLASLGDDRMSHR